MAFLNRKIGRAAARGASFRRASSRGSAALEFVSSAADALTR
jgi:hypothetical protein